MALQQKIEAFLAPAVVDFEARRPPVEMEDQSDGQGPYISRWDASLGPVPTVADGFTEYELHRLAAAP